MKLITLLEQHRTHASGLPENLGDGYLVAKNSIFRAIRQRAKELGYRFSFEQNDAYRSLSLSQLDTILKTKTIPYVNNVSVLQELENKIPKQTEWNDISDNLKGNSVFHEACHGVARSFAPEEPSDPIETAKTLQILLEESFANACELLSIIDAQDQVHRVFLELNSYVYMLDDRPGLAAAAKEMGLAVLLRFTILAYLQSNFLRPMSEKDFERCVQLATEGKNLDLKQKKSLRAVSKIAFKLNPRFREVTTRFYLKLNGIQTEISSMQSFDFLKVVETSRACQSFLASAAKSTST